MKEEMELTQEERKKMNYKYGERKICAECKKKFFVSTINQGSYVYKQNGRFYCSWTCYRKGKKNEKRRN